MAIETTRADLLGIEQAHQDVHDGGYRLVLDLCNYRGGMPEGSAQEWDEVLVAWVRDGSARFWGVALEALARTGGACVNDELAAMLNEPDRSDEWREYVVNTLIRRGVSNAELMTQVEEAARRMSPMGLPNLAALMILEPKMLASAAACIAAAVSAGKCEYVAANVPPFVYAAADSDPEVLVRLVQSVQARDQEAGRRFGGMVAEYLREPFIRRRFKQGVAAALAKVLRGAAMD